MIKKALRIISLIVPLTVLLGAANETFVLKDVLYPQKLSISGEDLIVVDDFRFHLFSLKDFQRLTSFGREGDGPGELQSDPYFYNSVVLTENDIFVDSANKILLFSRDGTFLRQKLKPVGINQMWPVGENYLGLNQAHLEGEIQYVTLSLIDAEMEKVKELARQISAVQSARRTTECIFDTLNFAVLKEEIFVERSREGFVIDVFDSRGEKIREIKRDIKRIPVGKKDRDMALEYIKSDPTVKNLLGFERLKEMTKLIYPDTYPSITALFADKNQLYVLTSNKKNGRTECLVLDSQGQELEKVFIPVVNHAPFISELLGIQFFTIADRKLYYAEVVGDETVLHVEDFNLYK